MNSPGAIPGCGLHGEEGIDEMRSPERHEVCPAGRQDGIDLVGRRDVADAHGRHLSLVADLIRKRGLEHPPIDWTRLANRLARRDIDEVDAMVRKPRATSTATSPVTPPAAQSVADTRTDIGL